MTVRYRSRRPDDRELRDGCEALAHERRRFGYRRLHVLLRREGFTVNHKRLFRLYREERLMVRRRGGRKRALGTRAPMVVPHGRTIAGPSTLSPISSSMAAASASWRGRRLHPECLALVRRHLDLRHAGRPRARPLSSPRQAHDHRQRQRHRADQHAILRWSDRPQGRVALHRARQARPECLRRELQSAASATSCSNETLFISLSHTRARSRSLACRLQQRTAPFAARLDESSHLRRSTAVRRAALHRRLRSADRRHNRPTGHHR